MPYYSDFSYYYGGTPPLLNSYITPPPYSSFAGYTRALTGSYGTPVLPSSRTMYSPSRYTPMLTTISEAPYVSRRALSSLTRSSPKVSMHISPKYIAPRPIPINTADIDVSASRYKVRDAPSKPLDSSTNANAAKDPPRDMDDQSPYMPRCDTNDDCEVKKPIKRDRTVVRISTMRAKSGRKSPKVTKEKPIMMALEIQPPATPTDVTKKTWRDNFAEEFSPKPKEPQKKSPGERLLERHLIKHEDAPDAPRSPPTVTEAQEYFTFDCIPQGARLEERRPSFHDICQDISSDKLETVDDLNAGELRRRASLMDQEVDLVNKVTKSASGTLHCILERHTDGQDVKKPKVKHKITCSVGIDEPTRRPVVVAEEEGEGQNSTPIKVKKKLNAVVEHIEEHVVQLPKKKTTKKPAKTDADDIWSGMRETVYCNKRRQEKMAARQVDVAFQEEPEEMCAEIVPQEQQQHVVVEKKTLVVVSEEKSASILAPVSRENSVKVSKPSQSDAAKVHSSPDNGVTKTKKVVLTKSCDKTLSTSADNGVKIQHEKECEKLTMRASLKIQNGPHAKSPEVAAKSAHVEKGSKDQNVEKKLKKSLRLEGPQKQKNTTLSTAPSTAKNCATVTPPSNEEVPHVANDRASAVDCVTPQVAREVTSMANAAIVSEIKLNDHDEITTCNSITDEEVNIFKSHSGKISKFPTFTNLNELSLVCDQSEKSMAIEVDGECLDTSKTVATPTTSASDVPKSETKCDGGEKVEGPKKKVVKKKIIVKKVVKKSPKKQDSLDLLVGEQVVVENVDTADSTEITEVTPTTESILPENSSSSDKGVFLEAKVEYFEDMTPKGHRKKTHDKKDGVGFNPQKCMKFSPSDQKKRCYDVDEKTRRVLYATPRPLQKQKKKPIEYYSSDESDIDDESHTDGSSQTTSSDDEFFDCPSPADHMLKLYAAKDVRMSTSSNDSGFEGGTAPSSPKQMFGKNLENFLIPLASSTPSQKKLNHSFL